MSQLSKWLLSGSTLLWAPRRGRTWTWRRSWGPKMTCRWSSKCHRSRRTQIVSIVLVRWNQSNWLNKELCPRTRGYGYDGPHVPLQGQHNGRASSSRSRRKELYFQLPLHQLRLQPMFLPTNSTDHQIQTLITNYHQDDVVYTQHWRCRCWHLRHIAAGAWSCQDSSRSHIRILLS